MHFTYLTTICKYNLYVLKGVKALGIDRGRYHRAGNTGVYVKLLSCVVRMDLRRF